MRNIQRLTDDDTAPAPVISTLQTTVFAENLLVAVDGSPVQPHGVFPHSAPVTANGSPNVFINNIPVNRLGDADSCGHERDDRRSRVFVN